MAKTLKGTVKEILGTARSIGCTIDGGSPASMVERINSDEIDVPDE